VSITILSPHSICWSSDGGRQWSGVATSEYSIRWELNRLMSFGLRPCLSLSPHVGFLVSVKYCWWWCCCSIFPLPPVSTSIIPKVIFTIGALHPSTHPCRMESGGDTVTTQTKFTNMYHIFLCQNKCWSRHKIYFYNVYIYT